MKKNTLESLNAKYQDTAKIILLAAGMDEKEATEQTTGQLKPFFLNALIDNKLNAVEVLKIILAKTEASKRTYADNNLLDEAIARGLKKADKKSISDEKLIAALEALNLNPEDEIKKFLNPGLQHDESYTVEKLGRYFTSWIKNNEKLSTVSSTVGNLITASLIIQTVVAFLVFSPLVIPMLIITAPVATLYWGPKIKELSTDLTRMASSVVLGTAVVPAIIIQAATSIFTVPKDLLLNGNLKKGSTEKIWKDWGLAGKIWDMMPKSEPTAKDLIEKAEHSELQRIEKDKEKLQEVVVQPPSPPTTENKLPTNSKSGDIKYQKKKNTIRTANPEAFKELLANNKKSLTETHTPKEPFKSTKDPSNKKNVTIEK